MRQMILRLLMALRNAPLAARRGFLRASAKDEPNTEKKSEQPPTARPITALLPATLSNEKAPWSRRTWGKDEPRPSQVHLTKHMRMILTKYAIVLCLALALVCVIAVPVLSSIKVRHIRVEGAMYYTEQDIISLTEISIGDELLKHDMQDIEARLTEKCPYLLSVRVRREGAGLSIVLTESTPRWALMLPDGRVALVDGERYIGEVCEQSQAPEGLCTLYMSLPMLPSEQNDEVLLPQIAQAGQYIKGTSPALTLLEELSSVLDAVALPSAPATLDLNDVYSVTLTLADGTQLLLHECSAPEQQLSRAATAIQGYVATHPDLALTHTLVVDVDDTFRVSVRSVPKNSQENGESEQE
ncbi:MAG: FtsQ-type POTRA domain-containing protein [Clostridia bacterium]|nr:FtsQ-type POTRA domain-containing protein [Clostridia bacterium]